MYRDKPRRWKSEPVFTDAMRNLFPRKRQIDFPLCTSTIPLVFLVLPLVVCLTLLACIPSSLYFFRFPFVPLVRGFSFFDRLELERVNIR